MEELLFYREYEQFYAAAAQSRAFSRFCLAAYGADFSQDGFSDIAQVERIFAACPLERGSRVLDIGCGNGGLLRYIHEKSGAAVCGFDYSGAAIKSAQAMGLPGADFRVGTIGQTDYPAESFDLVISMDTMYFAPDMTALAAQIKRWLRPGGVLFAGYQEGDVVPKTQDAHSTRLAQALNGCGMDYRVEEITDEVYALLCRKRQTAQRFCDEFRQEDRGWLYDLLMGQTECVLQPLEEYRRCNARYIYTASRR